MENLENIMKRLNKEQLEAVKTVEGPVLILAGAGSGKTTVLTSRIAYMIREKNIYPSSILAITFTNKAAGEMRERVKRIIGEEADRMWISTFHSACVRILRRDIDKIGYNSNFAIYDSDDQRVLIRDCMKELSINEKDITDREIIGKIGDAKDRLISAEEFKRTNSGNYRQNKIADVYLLYEKKKKGFNALDFDDLIYKTVELFNKNKEVLDFYRRKFKYIMVDEYQDTNHAQYKLVNLLSQEHKNICVVGDDDQCIYQWRGADINNILDFEKDYGNAKVIKLEENYRSYGNILKAANSVIRHNVYRKGKALRTEAQDGEKLRYFRAESDKEEARFVASEILRLKDEGKSYGDIAVLYRTNAQSRLFEEAFINSIPYKLIGGTRFYERREIKDILAYLKLINNPLDDISLKRIINVPKRNIGGTTVQKIQEYANELELSLYNALLDVDSIPGLTARSVASVNKFLSLINSFIKIKEDMKVSDLIKSIMNDTGYLGSLQKSTLVEDRSRIENLEELVTSAVQFEETSEDISLDKYLEDITLVADVDKYDENVDAVTLMTLHSAKGLEFPIVFMAGMENGLFPGNKSFSMESEMEESRRLCYVGITRAKERLYLTGAEMRMQYGRHEFHSESDFILEIPKDLIEPAKEEKIVKPEFRRKASFDPDFKPFISKNADKRLEEDQVKIGIKVKHKLFGKGTVITVDKSTGTTKLKVAFENMGIKDLILDMAPLELL